MDWVYWDRADAWTASVCGYVTVHFLLVSRREQQQMERVASIITFPPSSRLYWVVVECLDRQMLQREVSTKRRQLMTSRPADADVSVSASSPKAHRQGLLLSSQLFFTAGQQLISPATSSDGPSVTIT